MKYTGEYTKEISFPLGGIGSGSIGIGGDGRLRDWEIFNRPAKGSLNGNTHMAVKAVNQNGVVAKVLNGDVFDDFAGEGNGTGVLGGKMSGFPHFKNVEFDGQFPMATLSFQDELFPATVKLTAFNPLIPLDKDNSSIPGAFFLLRLPIFRGKRRSIPPLFRSQTLLNARKTKSSIKTDFRW